MQLLPKWMEEEEQANHHEQKQDYDKCSAHALPLLTQKFIVTLPAALQLSPLADEKQYMSQRHEAQAQR